MVVLHEGAGVLGSFPGAGKAVFDVDALRFCGSDGAVDGTFKAFPLLVAEEGHEVSCGPVLGAVLADLPDGVEGEVVGVRETAMSVTIAPFC